MESYPGYSLKKANYKTALTVWHYLSNIAYIHMRRGCLEGTKNSDVHYFNFL